jgi:ribonuclease T1
MLRKIGKFAPKTRDLMGLKQIRGRKNWVSQVGAWAVTAVLAVSASTFLVQARSPSGTSALSQSGSASVALTGLPAQGQVVMAQIREGGPFRYEKDGTVFGNRERLLPSQTRGYYREYTVITQGLSHRGPRRIVCGGRQPRQPDACFYIEDHYSSFRLIVQ